jgi:hypothetical protein
MVVRGGARSAPILIDGRVIASYSRGQIVLPKSNMLEETRGELFGQDYRQQLPYHLIFCSHVLLSWIIPNKICDQWRRGGISVAPPDQKVGFYLICQDLFAHGFGW